MCCDVGIEPALQPLEFYCATANREDGDHLDVVARDFLGPNMQFAFFDVRVFNSFVRSYFHSPLSKWYVMKEKRWAHDECIWEVEIACFSPLVFSATSGMGPTAITVFCMLASMLAEKWNVNYSCCLFWL